MAAEASVLTASFWNYDRTMPLVDGRVVPEGCRLAATILRPEESIARAFAGAEFDVWEPRGLPGWDVDARMPGAPTWFETTTPDVERVAKFYSALFGWRADSARTDYRILYHGGRPAAGVKLGRRRGTAPGWATYFAVADLEAATRKTVQLGGKVLTLSDSGGFIHDPDGITQEKIDWVKAHKTHRRGRIEDYCDEFKGASFTAGKTPWGVPCDVALPCATQNELLGEDARTLVANGCIAVSEGANMPTNLEGVHHFKHAKIMFAPGKAANAGGVAVSGLEMSQNSERRSWKEEELQQMLKDIMAGIHKSCLTYGDQGGGYIDYVKGANIAGFKKVADAMLAFGVV